jgi:hypothetical protein
MTTDQIIERFNARCSGGGWIAHCPGPLHAHGDKSPSLSISEGRDGRVLMNCFAGCSTDSILAVAGLSFSDLFADRRWPRESRPQIVRTMELEISGLRSRLTRREREIQEAVVIVTTPENLDAAICRGLALAVEGELCQIVMKEQ